MRIASFQSSLIAFTRTKNLPVIDDVPVLISRCLSRALVAKNLKIVNACLKGRGACPQASVEGAKADDVVCRFSKHSVFEPLYLDEQVSEVFQRGRNL
jgi:hypothetical protein